MLISGNYDDSHWLQIAAAIESRQTTPWLVWNHVSSERPLLPYTEDFRVGNIRNFWSGPLSGSPLFFIDVIYRNSSKSLTPGSEIMIRKVYGWVTNLIMLRTIGVRIFAIFPPAWSALVNHGLGSRLVVVWNAHHVPHERTKEAINKKRWCYRCHG